jgi:hypothetical protein
MAHQIAGIRNKTVNFLEDVSADVGHELVPVALRPEGDVLSSARRMAALGRHIGRYYHCLSSPKADVVANLWDVAIAPQLGPRGNRFQRLKAVTRTSRSTGVEIEAPYSMPIHIGGAVKFTLGFQ